MASLLFIIKFTMKELIFKKHFLQKFIWSIPSSMNKIIIMIINPRTMLSDKDEHWNENVSNENFM